MEFRLTMMKNMEADGSVGFVETIMGNSRL